MCHPMGTFLINMNISKSKKSHCPTWLCSSHLYSFVTNSQKQPSTLSARKKSTCNRLAPSKLRVVQFLKIKKKYFFKFFLGASECTQTSTQDSSFKSAVYSLTMSGYSAKQNSVIHQLWIVCQFESSKQMSTQATPGDTASKIICNYIAYSL